MKNSVYKLAKDVGLSAKGTKVEILDKVETKIKGHDTVLYRGVINGNIRWLFEEEVDEDG